MFWYILGMFIVGSILTLGFFVIFVPRDDNCPECHGDDNLEIVSSKTKKTKDGKYKIVTVRYLCNNCNVHFLSVRKYPTDWDDFKA